MPSLHTRAAHRAEQGRYLRSTRDVVVCACESWTGEADPLLEAAGGGRPGASWWRRAAVAVWWRSVDDGIPGLDVQSAQQQEQIKMKRHMPLGELVVQRWV
jgi:hypothetical protein